MAAPEGESETELAKGDDRPRVFILHLERIGKRVTRFGLRQPPPDRVTVERGGIEYNMLPFPKPRDPELKIATSVWVDIGRPGYITVTIEGR